MRQLIVFILKEFKHIFRDHRTLLILFGMPVAQVFLFGYAVTNEVRDAELTVWDRSGDYLSGELISSMVGSGYFKYEGQVTSDRELADGFKSNRYKLGLVIPPNFARDVFQGNAKVQLLLDASDPNTANILNSYASAIIGKFISSHTKLHLPLNIQTEVRMTYNPELKGVFLFVPGVITVILMLVSALLTSIALAREKEMGTMEILLVSPLQPATVVIGKVIPYLGLSFVNALVVLLLGFFVFGMPLHGNLVLLLSEFILFIICALSIGIFISTKAASQQVAMMMSLFALMMPTILLSGFIFPIDSMPRVLQWLSYIIPAKYFIQVVKGIMLQGTGLSELWKPTLAIAGISLFFIIASIKNFKTRLA